MTTDREGRNGGEHVGEAPKPPRARTRADEPPPTHDEQGWPLGLRTELPPLAELDEHPQPIALARAYWQAFPPLYQQLPLIVESLQWLHMAHLATIKTNGRMYTLLDEIHRKIVVEVRTEVQKSVAGLAPSVPPPGYVYNPPPMRREFDSQMAREEITRSVKDSGVAQAQKIQDSPDKDLTVDAVGVLLEKAARDALDAHLERDQLKRLQAAEEQRVADVAAAVIKARADADQKIVDDQAERKARRDTRVKITLALISAAGVAAAAYLGGHSTGHDTGHAEGHNEGLTEGLAESKAHPVLVAVPVGSGSPIMTAAMAAVSASSSAAVPVPVPAAIAPAHRALH